MKISLVHLVIVLHMCAYFAFLSENISMARRRELIVFVSIYVQIVLSIICICTCIDFLFRK